MNKDVKNEDQNGLSKIEKAYTDSLNSVVALFKGEGNLATSTKVDATSTSKLIDELIKEEKEEAEKNFKLQAKNLLKEKVAFDKFITAKELEFKKAIDEKKKEFTIKAKQVIGLVQGIDKIKADYVESLKA